MLRLEHLDAYYGASHTLQDISLAVDRGGILTVLGRNGVGKSTLLKAIMGLAVRTTGQIDLDGRDLSKAPTYERARAGIGYVPQGREIFADFTVEENIMMGSYARKQSRSGIPDIVFDLFPVLRQFLRRPGGVLSGGQQQQLAIARALVAEPQIMLMDEPTEGIQPNIVEQIQQTIRRLNRELGLTIVLVEQNVQFARTACEKFVILQKGSIAAGGSVGELSDDLIRRYMTV